MFQGKAIEYGGFLRQERLEALEQPLRNEMPSGRGEEQERGAGGHARL